MSSLAFATRYLTPILLTSVLALSSAAQSVDPTGIATVTVTGTLLRDIAVSPGVARNGTITLHNSGDISAWVTIKPADMGFTSDGSIRFAPRDTVPRSNASWIDVPSQVEVPAQSSLHVPFTINVPNDPDLHGSYWSVLQVQPVAPSVVRQESADARVTTSVNVVFQYSVTLLTHVGTTSGSTLTFARPGFEVDPDGSYRFVIGLSNPGAFVVESESWLELYDSEGVLVKRVEGQKVRTYPDAMDMVHFELGRLDPDHYQLVVIANAGPGSIFGTRYTFDATAQ